MHQRLRARGNWANGRVPSFCSLQHAGASQTEALEFFLFWVKHWWLVGEVALAEGSLVNSWFNHCYGVSHLGSTWWVGEATWINQDWKTSKRVPACPLNSMPLSNRFCSTSKRGAASATIMVSHGRDLSAVSDVFCKKRCFWRTKAILERNIW